MPQRNFWEKHREANRPLKAWHYEAARAVWKKPTDIKAQYRNASILSTKADHKAALKLVSKLVDLDPAPRTPDGDMLDVMSTLVAAYEAKHFSIEPADPIEAIKFRMDQHGLAPRDLDPLPYIGAEPVG